MTPPNKGGGRCRDCRHWDQAEDESGVCVLTGSLEGVPDRPASKATAYDWEGLHAWLYTAPDFGCNQWEAR